MRISRDITVIISIKLIWYSILKLSNEIVRKYSKLNVRISRELTEKIIKIIKKLIDITSTTSMAPTINLSVALTRHSSLRCHIAFKSAIFSINMHCRCKGSFRVSDIAVEKRWQKSIMVDETALDAKVDQPSLFRRINIHRQHILYVHRAILALECCSQCVRKVSLRVEYY